MFSGFKTSASSSVLQTPTEHFTSLNSPGATVRARPASSGDGMLSSGGGGDKHHGHASSSLVHGHAPSPPAGISGGGSSSAAAEAAVLRALAAHPLPTGGAVRRAMWVALQSLLVAGTLRYLSRLTPLQRDAYFLYYQPFMPMLAMLWFWSLAVRIFERRRIRYEVCFSPEDQRFLLRSTQLFQICNVLTALVLSSGFAFAYLLVYGQPHVAAYHPPLLYTALLVLLLFPGPLLFRETRLFFGQTLWRVATPIRGVTWADFLLADVLTSLAKALSDTERAVCHLMVGGDVMQPHLRACSDASFIIPLGLAAPYAWRLVQCIRVYLDTGARPQIFNAIKYSTAFPVILLSAIKYHVDPADWRSFYKPLWLAAALLNSSYSFFWDVERDWEISWFSQMGPGSTQRRLVPSPVLRGQLLYRRPFYLYLMASNLLLRLSWAYKLSPHLRNHHVVVFLIVLAEAFRRFQWLFVRIEVELRKIQAYRPDLGVLVPPVGYAAHAHSSEAADSGSEGEDEVGGRASGAKALAGAAGPKARGLGSLPTSTSAGPVPGKPRMMVKQLSAGGGEIEMLGASKL